MDCCESPVAMARVVCPKPRRAGPINAAMPLRFHICNNDAESRPGAELLGQILRKEDLMAERCATPSSSPPFFFGSPPCRTSNPLIQDAHFGVVKLPSACKSPTDSVFSQSLHAREQYGKQKAAVRVEGFDCQGSRAFPLYRIH